MNEWAMITICKAPADSIHSGARLDLLLLCFVSFFGLSSSPSVMGMMIVVILAMVSLM